MSAVHPHGCFHCGLAIPPDCHYQISLDKEPRSFCCFGCQSVCEAIFSAGLQGYYQRTPEGALLAPPPLPPKDIAMYD
ncbi:MAG: heavy metal translocating P-type ATPase metal-binding domain-containing protein, partial [Gallionella sp.]